MHEKSKIPFSYMLYAYSVKRAYICAYIREGDETKEMVVVEAVCPLSQLMASASNL